MPPKLTSAEINYIVALYGDISFEARKRLFERSSLPAHLASQIMRDGYDFVGLLRDGSRRCRKLAEDGQGGRQRARKTFPYGSAGHPGKRTDAARTPGKPPSGTEGT